MNTDILLYALKFYGVQEIVGEKHNGQVLEFFSEIGHSWVKEDELAWCSAFVNYVLKKTGYRITGKLNARSWMDDSLGMKIKPEKAQPGDIVVFSRTSNPAYGHVAIFINYDEDGKNVNVLGGNQGNAVKISPYAKSRILKILRPHKNAESIKKNINRVFR